MLGTFRADFYRLFRTFGFWASQLLIIGFIVVTIASKSVGRIVGVGDNSIQEIQADYAIQWTGVVSVNAEMFMINAFFYAMLPLLVIIIGHDFSKKTYKNILTVGISRTSYFIVQYVTFAVMILIQVFYIYVVSFITGSLFYGVGDDFNKSQLVDWLVTGCVQFLMIMTILTICCFIIYLTKNSVLSILTAILLPLIISIIRIVFQQVKWIRLFDFQGVLSDSQFILSNSQELHYIILSAIIVIIVFIGLTIFQFNKSEL